MPGFIFWGLFLVLAMIVAGYIVWMFWIERSEQTREAREPETGRAKEPEFGGADKIGAD